MNIYLYLNYTALKDTGRRIRKERAQLKTQPAYKPQDYDYYEWEKEDGYYHDEYLVSLC